MIEEAYAKGQTTISTTLQGVEMFEQDEIDQLITDLRARDIQVSHDDVFNDMSLSLPRLTLAERARHIAYNVDSVVNKNIKTMTDSIIELSQHGYTEMEEDFYNISDSDIIDQVHAYFSRSGFNVKRTDNPERNHSSLRIRWSK
jgi:hypothetical protein